MRRRDRSTRHAVMPSSVSHAEEDDELADCALVLIRHYWVEAVEKALRCAAAYFAVGKHETAASWSALAQTIRPAPCRKIRTTRDRSALCQKRTKTTCSYREELAAFFVRTILGRRATLPDVGWQKIAKRSANPAPIEGPLVLRDGGHRVRNVLTKLERRPRRDRAAPARTREPRQGRIGHV
jgi:hypothetical protein